MARPSLWTHRKFARLGRLLGASYRAAGVLEMVWRLAYECGDPVVGTSEDVEFAVGWDGEAGVCAQALVESGFLDELPGGFLSVHDMADHAPEYVKARQRKEKQRKGTGQSQPKTGQSREPTVTVTGRDRDCPPTPAPTPTPTHQGSAGPTILHDSTSMQSLEGVQKGRSPDGEAAPEAPPDPPGSLELTPEPSSDPPPGRRRRHKRGAEIGRLIAHYRSEFTRVYGAAPVLAKKAIAVQAANQLLEGRTLEEASAIVTEGLEHPDQWQRDKGRLRLEDLPSQATGILLRLQKKHGPRRAPDGRVAGSGPPATTRRESVERDEAGALRAVVVLTDAATGAETRRWGAVIDVGVEEEVRDGQL